MAGVPDETTQFRPVLTSQEPIMINMLLRDPISGITGKVTATSVMGDGKGLARIHDHWFLIDGLVPA